MLSIGDEGSILTCFEKRKLVKRVFVNSPASSEYLEMLKSAPKAPIYILVDVVDQAYIQHTLPPVSSMNVGKLVSRKLAKDFDDIDIKAAISMGRDKEGRKEWHYLFVSVRNIPPFSDWLDAVSNLPNPFKGIYLVPLESMYYLKDLQRVTALEKGVKPSGWQILVSHNRVGGFRQVVFRNNKIIFTRIAQPIGGQTADVVAGNIEQETLNTIEYIRRLGYDDSEGLDVFIVASTEVKAVLELNALPATSRTVMTPSEIAMKLALENAAEDKDRFGDVVAAAHFIASKKHALKLGTPYTKKLGGIVLANKALRAAGVLGVIGMLGFTGYSFLQNGSVKEEIARLEREQQAQRQKFEAEKTRRQKFEQSPDMIIAMAGMDETLSRHSFLPLDFIESFSKATTEDTLAKDLAINIAEEEPQPLSGTANIVFPPSETGIDRTLDQIEQYKAKVTAQLKDYELTFSNPLTDSIDITGVRKTDDKTQDGIIIEVQFTGPKASEEAPKGGAQGRRKLKK